MKAAWTRWLNFWFAAADPTTMSLIRVVTGSLIVYVHLAYCFDLVSFFGKDAWVTLDTINRDRREQPTIPAPFNEWEYDYYAPGKPRTATLPEDPHRRKAVADWIRNLPWDQPDALKKKLRLLDKEGILTGVQRERYDENIIGNGVRYSLTAGTDPEIRKNTLKALLGEIPPGANENFPDVFKQMPKDLLRDVADDIDGFASTLPAGNELPRIKEREYISLYFVELPAEGRNNLMKFFKLALASSEEKRKEQIEYLAYWNCEQRYCLRIGVPIFSIWFHVTDPVSMYCVHAVVLVIMVLFTIGYQTRITSVLTWMAAVSYLHRNQQILFGQDTMMNILLIYLMVANSGGALSVDRWLARRRAKAKGEIFSDIPAPSVTSGLAQRMLQVHFCFIYAASGLSKLKGNTWWNHNAFWDTVVNPEFTLVHYDWYQELLRATMSSRPIFALAAAACVGFTLFIEIGGPFLFWTRLRPYAVVMGMMLHAGIGIFMGLLVFSLMMMTMLISFLPGSMIREQLDGDVKPPGQTPGDAKPKSKKMLAGILGILLGEFGVHKFYLGYTTQGMLQIAITILTCGIGGIIGVIEGIIYLMKSDEEFAKIYQTGRKHWF